MSDKKKYPTLVWLDLEMTGLDPNAERIIEIYTCITNEDLTEIIEGPGMVISQSKKLIDSNLNMR